MEKNELQIAIASIPWNVIAAVTGVKRQEVYRWKTGKAFPHGEKLLKLMELIKREKSE